MVTVRVQIDPRGIKRLEASVGSLASTGGHPAWRDMRTGWLKRVESFTRRRFNTYSRGGGDWPALTIETVLKKAKRGNAGKKRFSQADATALGSAEIVVSKKRTRHGVAIKRKRMDLSEAGEARVSRGSLVRAERHGALFTRSGNVATNVRTSILRDTGALFNSLALGSPGNVGQHIPNGVRYGVGGAARAAKGKLTLGRLAEIHDRGEGHNPRRRIIVLPDDQTVRGMQSDARRAIDRIIRESGA